MFDTDGRESLKKLTFEVLHPIRDYVIEHGAEKIPGQPFRFLSMAGFGPDDEELVICSHASKAHTRLHISLGDAVLLNRTLRVLFSDEPESVMFFDTAVNPEDLVTLSKVIRAGKDPDSGRN